MGNFVVYEVTITHPDKQKVNSYLFSTITAAINSMLEIILSPELTTEKLRDTFKETESIHLVHGNIIYEIKPRNVYCNH